MNLKRIRAPPTSESATAYVGVDTVNLRLHDSTKAGKLNERGLHQSIGMVVAKAKRVVRKTESGPVLQVVVVSGNG